jgi:hypothetical protein
MTDDGSEAEEGGKEVDIRKATILSTQKSDYTRIF